MKSPKVSMIRAALLSGIALSSVGLSVPAWAQDAMAEQAGGTDDIIVTARRREESLQDVPIAVSAFSGEALELRGALDLTEIGNITPNTTLETSRGSNSTLSAFIRGIGQQDRAQASASIWMMFI